MNYWKASLIFLIWCKACLTHGEEVFFGLKFFNCAQSCKGRCNTTADRAQLFLSLQCNCDEWCVVFGDCCRDFYSLCKGISQEEDILKSMEDAQPPTVDKKRVEVLEDFMNNSKCNTVNSSDGIHFTEQNILSIRSCATDYPDADDRDKCEGKKRAFPLDIPVSIADEPFLTFHNIYCAKCNNFPLNDKILFWKANLQCMVDLDVTLTSVQALANYNHQMCTTIVSPPDSVDVRYCNIKIEDRPCSQNKHLVTKKEVNEETNVTHSRNDFNKTNIEANPSSISFEPLEEESVPPFNITVSTITILEPSTKLAKQNLKTLCDAYISPGQFKNRLYKNPHCYACEEGWDVFVDSNITRGANEIPCFFMSSGIAIQNTRNTKLVDHNFGLYSNQFIFFSSDTGRLLDDNFRDCSKDRFYNSLSGKCDLVKCPQGSTPYFGSCVDDSYKLRHLHPQQNNTSLFISIEATWGGQNSDFPEFIKEVIEDLESLPFNTVLLLPKSPLRNFTRKLDIRSVKIKEKGYDETVVLSDGVKMIKRHVANLHFEMAADFYFKDIQRLVNDFTSSSWSGLYLRIEEITLRNYDDDMLCVDGKLVNYTSPNMTIIDIDRNIFVDIDGELIDLKRTWFILKSDRNSNRELYVQSLYICEDLKISSSIKVLSIAPVKKTRITINPVVPKLVSFKVVGAGLALTLKLLSFILALCRRTFITGGTYFHVLGLSSAMIDIVHLLENAAFATFQQALSISLHFSWLFSIYSSLAWCINMVTLNTKTTLKCLIRHLVISCIVPVTAIAICATGDINDPPWNMDYGRTDNIFAVSKNAFLYGYVVPVCIGVAIIILAHAYRLIRRKIFQKDRSFYSCNMVITFLLVLQFCLGSSERLELSFIFYYLYFTTAIIVGWTFLAISTICIWGDSYCTGPRSLSYTHNVYDNSNEKNIEINQ